MQLGPDVFVRRMGEELELADPRGPVVITDVRFENEAEFVRTRGGYIVHVHRPGAARTTESTHPSERPLSVAEGDHVLRNDGTLQELEARVWECVESIADAQ